ncbi:PadR family transcriptional regulator [Enterococcus gallinarum]|uniref:PadR family transcriptional regulator n=1 Tax=Enterococcus gallinarum TaxID=1353 RepID=UPI00391B1172
MISSDGIRGYNDAIILSILSKDDSYGYDISKQIREKTDSLYIIKETTLYSAFTRLEKQGLIRSYPGEVTHGKKRTYYQISEAGREFLEVKKQEWQQTKIIVERFLQGGAK